MSRSNGTTNNGMLLGGGIIGAALVALCCLTPALVAGLGGVGLSAWLGWIDYALFPALLLFGGVTAYALWRRGRAKECCSAGQSGRLENSSGAKPTSPYAPTRMHL